MNLVEEYKRLKHDRVFGVAEGIAGDPEEEGSKFEPVEGFNILILTSSTDSKNRRMSKKNPTILKFEKHCEDNGIPHYTAYADTAYLEKDDDGAIKIYNVGDDKGHEIDRDKTFVIARRGVMFHRYSLNLMTRLERYRFCFLNERHAIEICEDKHMTLLKLVSAGLPVPKSALVPTEEMLEMAHDKVGGKFPVIVKTLSGTQGKGVFVVNDFKGLKSSLQALWSVGGDVEMMLQEYIKSDYDIRVHVLGDKAIAAMRRDVVENDFRSNVHLGGQTKKFKVTKDIEEMAVAASKSVKANWSGVDIMFDTRGNPYVLEVNASPGTDGIEDLTKTDIVGKVMEYASDGNNWTRPAQEVGVLETLELDGIGEVVARFDTGNAAQSASLDAQDVSMDGGKVTWQTNGKKFSAPKVDEVRIKHNEDSGEKNERRPVVSLDVTFEGVTYKDILFNLNDRSHKSTPVLINKDFMIKSGSVVNPARIYMVTKKPEELKKKKKKKVESDREEN